MGGKSTKSAFSSSSNTMLTNNEATRIAQHPTATATSVASSRKKRKDKRNVRAGDKQEGQGNKRRRRSAQVVELTFAELQEEQELLEAGSVNASYVSALKKWVLYCEQKEIDPDRWMRRVQSISNFV